MKLITKVFLLVTVIILLLLQYSLVFINLKKNYWIRNDIRVLFRSGVITIFDIYDQDPLITIAPYQDFVYFDQYPTSLRNDFISLGQKNSLLSLLSGFFSPDRQNWFLAKPAINYEYDVKFINTNLVLTRSVTENNSIKSIGNSLSYCFHCQVINETNNSAYYNELDLTSDNLRKSQILGYKLVKFTSGVEKPQVLSIINVLTGKKVSVEIDRKSKINLFDAWRVLEIVQPVNDDGKTLSTTQTIIL